MARIVPDGWEELSAEGVRPNEVDTLRRLAKDLPDEYTVYHGVCWTKVEGSGFSIFGEIDFVILEPSGSMLLVEQKDGYLLEEPDGLTKDYLGKKKNVAAQMGRNAQYLMTKLKKRVTADGVWMHSLLYCPDHIVRKLETAGVPAESIVDGRDKANLAARVQKTLPCREPRPDVTKTIHAVLADVMDLVPDPKLALERIGVIQTRLSGGLSTWARKLEFTPFRLRVVGTAGSGKTQLAMGVIADAVAAGRRVMYVCYNRPLADHVHHLAGKDARTVGYHELCDKTFRATGGVPDFSVKGVFGRLETFMDGYRPAEDELVDELVVDEGQDFKDEWRANVLRFLKPGGRAWWMEDPLQNLYDRPPLTFDNWVTLRSDANYRSPKELLKLISLILPPEFGSRGGSPLTTANVELPTYEGGELFLRTAEAVRKCLAEGYTHQQIAVVTFRGWENSAFKALDSLDGLALIKATGTYDSEGNPLYSEGLIRIDSVHRLKGHSIPCVILTEVDFATMMPIDMRKLFVGITRATAKFVMVSSERSMTLMLERVHAH